MSNLVGRLSRLEGNHGFCRIVIGVGAADEPRKMCLRRCGIDPASVRAGDRVVIVDTGIRR